MSKKKSDTSITRKSALAEFNYLSGSIFALLIAIIVFSIGFFIAMYQSPPKKVSITDDADIFTRSEMRDIEEIAEKLSKRDNINVVIITTRNKNSSIRGHHRYSNSDEDCNEFAADYYTQEAVKHSFRDNSGICILIDLTLDYSGGRYFRLYTNGTAYYAISNSEADDIFRSHKSELANEEYGEAIQDILHDVSKHDFNDGLVFFLSNIMLIFAIPLALLFTRISSRSKKLDKAPSSDKYRVQRDISGFRDTFLRKTVSTVRISSSSGGGGGGGGFSGGGHSGGGGGRF